MLHKPRNLPKKAAILSLRGRGHNAAGASSIRDGLVINLSCHMNEVTIDPSKKFADVGGGALWEIVDKEGIKHGLATAAGTENLARHNYSSTAEGAAETPDNRPDWRWKACLAIYFVKLISTTNWDLEVDMYGRAQQSDWQQIMLFRCHVLTATYYVLTVNATGNP